MHYYTYWSAYWLCYWLVCMAYWVAVLGHYGVHRLADALQHCPQLAELNLSGNKIGNEGASRLQSNR